MLKITGGIFLAIGLATGAALVASPFGLLAGAAPSAAAWLLFPGGFAAGSVLLALGDRSHELGWLWRICAASLLALATASALGLALPVLGVLEPAGQTVSLWYVLLLSGLIGTACALAPTVPSASS
jgi:hypothetical protein